MLQNAEGGPWCVRYSVSDDKVLNVRPKLHPVKIRPGKLEANAACDSTTCGLGLSVEYGFRNLIHTSIFQGMRSPEVLFDVASPKRCNHVCPSCTIKRIRKRNSLPLIQSMSSSELKPMITRNATTIYWWNLIFKTTSICTTHNTTRMIYSTNTSKYQSHKIS